MSTRLTRHSKDRMKERAGIPSSAQEKAAEKAWKQGICKNDVAGKLHRYLVSIKRDQPGHALRIWAEKIWCFTAGGVLITILNLPREFARAANSAKRKNPEGTAPRE